MGTPSVRYSFATPRGTFYIVPRGNRWHIVYEGEDLGSYISPGAAADDLAGGHTFSPSNGVDPSALGIPADVVDWSIAP